jgi:hypothetical protein
MTPAQWRIAGRAEAIVRRDIGRGDDDLAEMLGVSLTELVTVLRVLYRQKRVDKCWSWTVAPPTRRAA